MAFDAGRDERGLWHATLRDGAWELELVPDVMGTVTAGLLVGAAFDVTVVDESTLQVIELGAEARILPPLEAWGRIAPLGWDPALAGLAVGVEDSDGIRCAHWAGDRWPLGPVLGGRSYTDGAMDLAIDGEGVAHLVYGGDGWDFSTDLYHTTETGHELILYGVDGESASVTVDAAGRPHAAWSSYDGVEHGTRVGEPDGVDQNCDGYDGPPRPWPPSAS